MPGKYLSSAGSSPVTEPIATRVSYCTRPARPPSSIENTAGVIPPAAEADGATLNPAPGLLITTVAIETRGTSSWKNWYLATEA